MKEKIQAVMKTCTDFSKLILKVNRKKLCGDKLLAGDCQPTYVNFSICIRQSHSNKHLLQLTSRLPGGIQTDISGWSGSVKVFKNWTHGTDANRNMFQVLVPGIGPNSFYKIVSETIQTFKTDTNTGKKNRLMN